MDPWLVVLLEAKGVAVSVLANLLYDRYVRRASDTRVPWLATVAIAPSCVTFLLALARARWLLPDQWWPVVVAGLVAVGLVPWLSIPRRWATPTCLASLTGVFLLLLAIADRVWTIDIRLTCPAGKVHEHAVVQGRSRSTGLHLYVLIRPAATSQVFGYVVPIVDDRGGWQVSVRFGGESGEEFDVLAVASVGPLPIDNGRLRGFVPVSATRSGTCHVRRA